MTYGMIPFLWNAEYEYVMDIVWYQFEYKLSKSIETESWLVAAKGKGGRWEWPDHQRGRMFLLRRQNVTKWDCGTVAPL